MSHILSKRRQAGDYVRVNPYGVASVVLTIVAVVVLIGFIFDPVMAQVEETSAELRQLLSYLDGEPSPE